MSYNTPPNMLITEVNSSSKTDKTRKKKGASKSGAAGAFSVEIGAEASNDTPIAETQNIANIQSVLSIDSINLLSNAGNEDYLKQENISWGKDILKQLDGIKYQILNGKVSYSALLNLQERLNNIPINPADTKLRDIVQEIETRAAVEIEKWKRLSESTKVFINQEEVK